MDLEYKMFVLKNVLFNVGELVNEYMLKEVKSIIFIFVILRIENLFNRMKRYLG